MAIDNLTCPDCGGPMVSRANNRDGSRFWGCLSYPQCRGTRNVEGEAKSPALNTNWRDYRYDEPIDEAQDNLPSKVWQSRDRERWRP